MGSIFKKLLIGAVLFYGSGAAAAELRWNFAGWYGGGCFPNLTFDPHKKGRVYLVSDVAGIWRSENNGDDWSFITSGLENRMVTEVAVSPSLPHVLYSATEGGIFFSKNSGDNWIKGDDLGGRISFQRPENYRSISIDPRISSALCVGTASGEIHCSKDSGRNWVDIGAPKSEGVSAPIVALHHYSDGSGLLAATGEGIWRYHFLQKSWVAAQPVLSKITDLTVGPKGFVSAADGRVWTSDATGVKWSRSKGSHPGKVFRLQHDPKSSLLYAAWNESWQGGLVVSSTNADSWKSIGRTVKPDYAANPTRAWASADSKTTSLKVSPHDPNIIFRTDWWGVWRSSDYGRSFTERIIGAPNTVGTDLEFTPGGTIYAATMDNGLLRSDDMGKTYSAVFPSRGYDPEVNGHVWRVKAIGNSTIIATASTWESGVSQLVISTDDGASFRRVRSGLPAAKLQVNSLWSQGYPRGLAVDPTNRNVVYLGIDGDDGGGLFISKDRGATWMRSKGQPKSVRILNGLAVDQLRPEVLYWGAVGDSGGIYRSLDSGRNWELVFQGSRAIFDIHTAIDGSVYATGTSNGAKLYVSRDHGESWRSLGKFSPATDMKAVTTNPKDPKMIVVGSASWNYQSPQSFLLSRDGGITWMDIAGDLPPGAGAADFAFSPDGDDLFISRYAGGIYRLNIRQLADCPIEKEVCN